MKLAFVSDTHNYHNQITLEPSDILFHCGDMTPRGSIKDIEAFCDWFVKQPATEKVVIAGNHDFSLESTSTKQEAEKLFKDRGIHYLNNTSITLMELKIFGSPHTPYFGGWAFNNTGSEITKHWDLIPDNTNILLTHGPPRDILDWTLHGDRAGCPYLRDKIKELKQLKIHAFGHIHEAEGVEIVDGVIFINASICGIPYSNLNEPKYLNI